MPVDNNKKQTLAQLSDTAVGKNPLDPFLTPLWTRDRLFPQTWERLILSSASGTAILSSLLNCPKAHNSHRKHSFVQRIDRVILIICNFKPSEAAYYYSLSEGQARGIIFFPFFFFLFSPLFLHQPAPLPLLLRQGLMLLRLAFNSLSSREWPFGPPPSIHLQRAGTGLYHRTQVWQILDRVTILANILVQGIGLILNFFLFTPKSNHWSRSVGFTSNALLSHFIPIRSLIFICPIRTPL